jgi:hypothetical protein
MSKTNGTIEVTEQEVQKVIETFSAVNLDEVTNEAVRVKVSEFKEVDVLDDEGNPMLDPDGNPLKRRKPYTRTAEIYDLVPLPLYNRMVKLRDQIQNKRITQEEAIGPMGDMVYEVWKHSEPWMTKERFYETVHGETIVTLFTRFFFKSRLLNNKVSQGGNTTNANDGPPNQSKG